MTETSHASASTATPPKMVDSELNLKLSIEEDKDDWGNMFDSMNFQDKRKSAGGLKWQAVGDNPVSSIMKLGTKS